MSLVFGDNKKCEDKENDFKRKQKQFDDLRLFFLDDPDTQYNSPSNGFIHKFLSKQNME